MSRRSDLSLEKGFREFPATQKASSNQSHSVLRVQEDERKRISRELHDEIGQGLMALRLALGGLVKNTDEGPGGVRVRESLNILDDTIEGLRRIIGRLSPRLLEDLGLLRSIQREADLMSKRTGMKSRVTLPREMPHISPVVEIAVYRCVQEALYNISRHSHARNFTVMLASSPEHLSLHIGDDGEGFPQQPFPVKENFGLSGMRERIEELGGIFRIDSVRNKGSQIQIEIPLGDASALSNGANHRKLAGKAS